MTKVRQTFQISLTDVNYAIMRVQFVLFELSLTPPPPASDNFSNGPDDQYVMEVTSICSQQAGWLTVSNASVHSVRGEGV